MELSSYGTSSMCKETNAEREDGVLEAAVLRRTASLGNCVKDTQSRLGLPESQPLPGPSHSQEGAVCLLLKAEPRGYEIQ